MCIVKGRHCFLELLCAFPTYSQAECECTQRQQLTAQNKLKTILGLTKRNWTAADGCYSAVNRGCL
jgi:hypothetical protein